ncbi:MAG: putative molybdenum carrier protein [Proteobacteria bacterium]|nr:putative molybdenum carrier protein [Pseudomonadota bacterium]
MLTKIISGGQTGADQAALDIAIKLNIPYGGWIPKGRLTEDGPLAEKYELQEMHHETRSSFILRHVYRSNIQINF